MRAGADVQVLEARNRVGGRVFSLDNFISGQVIEAGAELIGGNHPTWMAYAKQFGLTMRDVSDEEPFDSPILLGGKRMEGKDAAALFAQVDQALSLMNADARQVNQQRPWDTPNAEQLDQRSVAEAAAQWPVDPAVRAVALMLLSNDNALEPSTASYLALLSNIAGGGIEAYWSETEIYRCSSGNQALAFKLAQALGAQRLQLRTAVDRLQLLRDGVRVTTSRGARLEADVVVLTAPPATWSQLGLEPSLPDGLKPYAGPAIKVLSRVEKPFWLDNKQGPNALTDTPMGEFWDASDGQGTGPNQPACLTVFSGGAAANTCLQVPRQQREQQFSRWIDAVYPNYGRWARRQVFMGWPEDRWTRCGYTSPTLGQVTRVYPRLAAGVQDRLFFAGEYTSLLFTGFMEGGLHSGAQLARSLAERWSLT